MAPEISGIGGMLVRCMDFAAVIIRPRSAVSRFEGLRRRVEVNRVPVRKRIGAVEV